MDTSENKKRVLDLAWRNYEGQVASRRRVADRVAIVLGAAIAAVGLMFKEVDVSAAATLARAAALAVLLVSLNAAFLCAYFAWAPGGVGIPSGTDRDSLWHFLVQVDDDGSAATVLGDICKATNEEQIETARLSWWLRACMACGGVAVIASMAFKLLGGAPTG
jgi:hypothetical protein